MTAADYDHKKVSVAETTFSSAIEEVVYVGSDHRHVLLRTKDGTLHQSIDRGMTWNDITEDLPHFDGEEHKGIHSISLNKKDRDVVAVGNGKSAVWLSFNAGVNFHLLRDFESRKLRVHNGGEQGGVRRSDLSSHNKHHGVGRCVDSRLLQRRTV